MVPVNVLGVDPGGRSTGLVLLEGAKVKRAEIVTRLEDDWADYVSCLAKAFDDYVTSDVAVAVEGVVAPKAYYKGKKQMLPVDSTIGVARVFGWVEMWTHAKSSRMVIVAPNKNGSGPLAAYPPELVGKREISEFGSGQLRHCRSAYDVALGGIKLLAEVRLRPCVVCGTLSESHWCSDACHRADENQSKETDQEAGYAHLARIREERGL